MKKKRRLNEHAFFTTILIGVLTLVFFILVTDYVPKKIGPRKTALYPQQSPQVTRQLLPPPPIVAYNTTRKSDRKIPQSPLQSGIEYEIPAFLPPPSSYADTSAEFSLSPLIQDAVNFWKNIYAYYGVDHVVIHDTDHLGIIYTALDFSPLNHQGLSRKEKYQARKIRVEQEVDNIQNIISNLVKGDLPITPKEKRVDSLLSQHLEANQWETAKKRVRSQTGLRDRFQKAVRKSGMYLNQMKDIFASYDLPEDLTYLVFVESMFENKSLSKVGAAGLWQIMPATAKNYLKINRWVDERLDPILATHAAAKILRQNYQSLQSWPLAINAYNSGVGRLASAARKMGTRDIGVIIAYYNEGGYQFASRNFYPSFLAARDIASNHENYLGALVTEAPFEYDVVQLPQTMSLHNIADNLGIDLATLHSLNPALKKTLFETETQLPRHSYVRIPSEMSAQFVAASYNRVRQLEDKLWHIVQNGDTLASIAAQYRIPSRDIVNTNQLLRQKLYPGEVIQIPEP